MAPSSQRYYSGAAAAYFLIAALSSQYFGYGISDHVKKPATIVHAPEPFAIPAHMPDCIHSALCNLIHSAISSNASYPMRFKAESRAAGCADSHLHADHHEHGREGKEDGRGRSELLLRLNLFNSTASESSANNLMSTDNHWISAKQDESHEGARYVSGDALIKALTGLLEDLKPTLRMRYKWAVAMEGQYWVEYHYIDRRQLRFTGGNKTAFDAEKKETAAGTMNRLHNTTAGHEQAHKSMAGDHKSMAGTMNRLHNTTAGHEQAHKSMAGDHYNTTTAAGKANKHGLINPAMAHDEHRKFNKTVAGLMNWPRLLNGSAEMHGNKTMEDDHKNITCMGARIVSSAGPVNVMDAAAGAGLSGDDGGLAGGDCVPRSDVMVSQVKVGLFGVLQAPHALVSQNNGFYLMMQGDCNLVLYTAAGQPLWQSHTNGKGTRCSLSLRGDGNLVISSSSNRGMDIVPDDDGGVPVWTSGSSISCPSIFILIMQNDGNAVVYDLLTGLPVWATGTNQ